MVDVENGYFGNWSKEQLQDSLAKFSSLVKTAADSIDSNVISDDSKLNQMSENNFRSRLSIMMVANCKVLSVFNNGISQIVDDQKMQDKINSKI